MAFRLQDTPSATRFAPILLVATAVGAIFNNIGAVADATAVSDSFLDHVSSLSITYFSTTTLDFNRTLMNADDADFFRVRRRPILFGNGR